MEEHSQICPYCMETVNPAALVCRWCGRLLQDDRPCPFCREPIRKNAIKCPHCASTVTDRAVARVLPRESGEKKVIDEKVTSSSIGAFLATFSLTAILYPPELHVTQDQIRLRKWTLLGLRTFEQKISTRKIASVRFHKGIIWASLTIETHGGAMADVTVPALDVDEAQRIVGVIEEVIQTREHEDDNDLAH